MDKIVRQVGGIRWTQRMYNKCNSRSIIDWLTHLEDNPNPNADWSLDLVLSIVLITITVPICVCLVVDMTIEQGHTNEFFSFSILWDWANWHKRPKAFSSCWPNAQKAKLEGGPHVIDAEKNYFYFFYIKIKKRRQKQKRWRERSKKETNEQMALLNPEWEREEKGKGKGSWGRNKEVVNNTTNMFGIMCVCGAHAYPPLLC